MKVVRTVKEDMTLKNNDVDVGKKKNKAGDSGDHTLENIDQGLKNLEKEFNIYKEEI